MSGPADRGAAESARIRAAYRQRDAAGGSAAYSFANPAYVFGMHELEAALLDALGAAGVPLTGRVLDVGSGSGYFLNRLREYGAADAVGVELMPERVAEGARRYPGLDLREGDAAALPFADGAFDVVTQFTVLSSVLDRGTRAAIAAEMWRVTRAGGAVVSVDMLPPPALRRLVRTLRRTPAPRGGTPVQGLTPPELAAMFGSLPTAHRRFGYHLGMGLVLRRSRLAAQVLVALPPARTHLVAVFRKP